MTDDVKQFVWDMYIDAAWQEKPTPMSVADAQYNIDCWKEDEVDMPDGLTAEMFADEWNRIYNADKNI